MALTNAERQANYKRKKEETIASLVEQNQQLLMKIAALEVEVKSLTEKHHKAEIAALKAQINTR